jgi:hypothetical protein
MQHLDAGDTRQENVEDQDVRLETEGEFDPFGAIGRRTDDLELPLPSSISVTSSRMAV